MNRNLLKLWKQILQLQEVETDKGKLVVESELAEGVEVFVEKEGEFVPAEDGEYTSEEKVIVVTEGRIVEIREKEEAKPEEAPAETDEEEAKPEDEGQEPDEKDARIAELEDKQTELEALLAEKDARIAELEAQLAEKQKELEMSSEKPAKEAVKQEKTGALRYFN
jgi:predicted RNase H-like nuclease (RuvC/YqgF family)